MKPVLLFRYVAPLFRGIPTPPSSVYSFVLKMELSDSSETDVCVKKLHRVLYLWFRASQIYCIIINQRDANSPIYYSLPDRSTCFGCCLHPSSGVHKTVVTISGTSHVLVWCGFKIC